MANTVLVGKLDNARSLITKCEDAYDDFLKNSPIPRERFLRALVQAVSENPKLEQCTQGSFLLSTAHAALCGLEVAGPMGQAAIVPFYNGYKKVYEAKFMPGYRGYVSLAHDNPQVAKFYARPVFDCDEFTVVEGTTEEIRHIPNMKRDDEACVIASYSVLIYKDGTVDFEVLPWRDLKKIEEFATSRLKDGQSSPYHGPFKDQMHMKAAIRRHAKRLPLGARFAHTVEIENKQLQGGVYVNPEIAERFGSRIDKEALTQDDRDTAIDISVPENNSEDNESIPFDSDVAFADICTNYSLSSKEVTAIAKKHKINVGEGSTEADFEKLEKAVQEDN